MLEKNFYIAGMASLQVHRCLWNLYYQIMILNKTGSTYKIQTSFTFGTLIKTFKRNPKQLKQ